MAIFNPFELESQYTHDLEALEEAAARLEERRKNYTATGYADMWAGVLADGSYTAKFESLKQQVAEAAEGLEAVEAVAVKRLIPPADNSDKGLAVAVGAELRLNRLLERLDTAKGGTSVWQVAAEILSQHHGSQFARLWVDEMEHRGVFSTDATDSASTSAALAVYSEEYRRVHKFIQLGRTVVNVPLANALRAYEKALAAPPYEGNRIAPNSVEHALSIIKAFPVSDVVAEPFKWSLDGTYWTAAEHMSARDAKQAERNAEVNRQFHGSTAANEEVK